MQEENFFCDEACISSATLFYLDKGSKRKVCQEHATKVDQRLYPIAVFHFISTAEDALIYLERLEKVKKGRSYLQKLKEKAGEELVIALQDIDSARNNANRTISETFEIMKRRIQQFHFQIEVGLEHANQEFTSYLKSREFQTSKIGTLLMTDNQIVPSMLDERFLDISFELVNVVTSSFWIAQIPLEQHLSAVLEQGNNEAKKLFEFAQNRDQSSFIELQIAALHCSDSIALHPTEQSLQLLKLLESKIAEMKKERNEAITEINTTDTKVVASLTEVHLKEIKSLEAAREWGKALQLYLRAVSYVKSFSCSKETARLYSSFANFLLNQQRSEEAKHYFTLALDIQQVHFPETVDTADTYESFGALYEGIQNLEEAETCYKYAVAIRKGKEPNNYETSRSSYKLGKMHLSLKRYEEAEKVLLSALIVQKTSSFNKVNLVCILWRLGEVFSGLKRYEEAIEYFQEAITDEDLKSERRARILTSLGDAYKCLVMNSEAEESYESALKIYELIDPHSIKNSKTLNTLGNRFTRLRSYEEAEFCYQTGLTVLGSTVNRTSALLLFNLGSLRNMRRMDTEAIHDYNATLRILVVHYPKDTLTSLTYLSLGLIYQDLHRDREAEHCFRSVIKIEDTRSPYSLINIEAICRLADLSNKPEMVEEINQRLIKFLLHLENEFPTEVVTAYVSYFLGMVRMHQFAISDAQNYMTKTLHILENFHPNQYILLVSAYFAQAKISNLQMNIEETLDYLLKAANIRASCELIKNFTEGFTIHVDYPVKDANQADELSIPLTRIINTLPNCFSSVYQLTGDVYFFLNQLLEAEFYYDAALEYAEGVGNEDNISEVLERLKEFYLQTDQMEKLRRLEQKQ